MVQYRKKPNFYVDKDPTRTRFLMDRKTGLLEGRRLVKKGERSDNILNIREKSSGEIYGFLPKGITRFPVKASNTSRGHLRRRL